MMARFLDQNMVAFANHNGQLFDRWDILNGHPLPFRLYTNDLPQHQMVKKWPQTLPYNARARLCDGANLHDAEVLTRQKKSHPTLTNSGGCNITSYLCKWPKIAGLKTFDGVSYYSMTMCKLKVLRSQSTIIFTVWPTDWYHDTSILSKSYNYRVLHVFHITQHATMAMTELLLWQVGKPSTARTNIKYLLPKIAETLKLRTFCHQGTEPVMLTFALFMVWLYRLCDSSYGLWAAQTAVIQLRRWRQAVWDALCSW